MLVQIPKAMETLLEVWPTVKLDQGNCNRQLQYQSDSSLEALELVRSLRLHWSPQIVESPNFGAHQN